MEENLSVIIENPSRDVPYFRKRTEIVLHELVCLFQVLQGLYYNMPLRMDQLSLRLRVKHRHMAFGFKILYAHNCKYTMYTYTYLNYTCYMFIVYIYCIYITYINTIYL